MIKIFTGEDRVRILEEIKRELGEKYETFEGGELSKGDLPGIFHGATLFSDFSERRIIIRDLSENKEVLTELSENIGDYSQTEAKVILFETKLDKRLTAVKDLVKAGLEIREFKAMAMKDPKAVFGIYDIALRNGKQAIDALEEIQAEQDPYMFFGLMVTQAMKRLEWKSEGAKERRAIKLLADIDMKMKTTAIEPWLLIKSFLARLSSL